MNKLCNSDKIYTIMPKFESIWSQSNITYNTIYWTAVPSNFVVHKSDDGRSADERWEKHVPHTATRICRFHLLFGRACYQEQIIYLWLGAKCRDWKTREMLGCVRCSLFRHRKRNNMDALEMWCTRYACYDIFSSNWRHGMCLFHISQKCLCIRLAYNIFYLIIDNNNKLK